MEQILQFVDNDYSTLHDWIQEVGQNPILFVCDGSVRFLVELDDFLLQEEQQGIRLVRFQEFQSNPLYEQVQEGVMLFRREKCKAILAIGGGSAIDVAKCIRIYNGMQGDGTNGSFLTQMVPENVVPFLAMPTTAGTGSEATRYAVIYYQGRKQSVTSTHCIPDVALLDPGTLKTLPKYQKKATMMDALCHAIESFWAVNSTEESRYYSREAIWLIMHRMDEYLSNTEEGRHEMLRAANLAGKAINITQTTAGHAMCYMITSIFGVAHGHAAILCDRILFPWMVWHTDRCVDARGETYLQETLDLLGQAMGCADAESGARKLEEIFQKMHFEIPVATKTQLKILKKTVNPDRLKNHPVVLDEETIEMLYRSILKDVKE